MEYSGFFAPHSDGETRLALDGNEQDTILLGSGSGLEHKAMRRVTAGNQVLRRASGSTLR